MKIRWSENGVHSEGIMRSSEAVSLYSRDSEDIQKPGVRLTETGIPRRSTHSIEKRCGGIDVHSEGVMRSSKVRQGCGVMKY